MEDINSILLILEVLLSISLIGLILMQQGKGADAGAAFGSGASATVFGARGSGNFFTKATTFIAILFFLVCLSLAYISSHRIATDGVTGSVTAQEIAPESAAPLSDLPPADGAVEAATESDLPPAE